MILSLLRRLLAKRPRRTTLVTIDAQAFQREFDAEAEDEEAETLKQYAPHLRPYGIDIETDEESETPKWLH